MTRWIMHVDMDAFFASVEQYRINPSLIGKPICVGPDPTEGLSRGVVRTASYEARDHGIYSGMSVSKAHSLCPYAIFVSSSYRHYRKASDEFMKVLLNYADEESVRQTSIDEAYMEISDFCKSRKEALSAAESVQASIRRSTRLPCSIGIGPNMSVAKIATGINKPRGITTAPHPADELRAFLGPLDVQVISGVGSKTAERLHKHGLYKLEQIQNLTIPQLVPIMGNSAKWVHDRACGIDDRPVKTSHHSRSSFSKETTFGEDISPNDIGMVYKTLTRLCDSLSKKLRKRNLAYQTVSIRLRYSDFRTILRSKTMPTPTDSFEIMEKTAISLYEENKSNTQHIRLLGVKLSNLQNMKSQMRLTQFA